jgi:formylglycine-generating enzyme required for sulfatase activity
MLGDALFERALAADRQRLQRHRDELLARMALHDDSGRRARGLNAPAVLAIETSPPGARVSLRTTTTGTDGRRRLGEARDLGVTPVQDVEIPSGSHLLTLEAGGRAARYPILLGRDERRRVAVDLPLASEIPPGFVYIPAGRFLFGSALDEARRKRFLSTVPVHEMETDAYLIARHEVTYRDWIAYLRALPPEERARRTPRIGAAALIGGLALRELEDGVFQLIFQPSEQAYTAAEGEPLTYGSRRARAAQDWQRFPVSGISLHDAEAYAEWLSATGRVRGARLCTEQEWERAARGADDRELPHGDALAPGDANFDETYGKEAASMGPDEVGSHPASRSPFGLDDMAGNVFEWTRSSLEQGKSVIRGGAYFYDALTALSTNRSTLEPGLRDPRLGVRLCAPAPRAALQASVR